jgi:uncharacterized protein YijF (DUF1287 family)
VKCSFCANVRLTRAVPLGDKDLPEQRGPNRFSATFGSSIRKVSKARRLFCQLAVGKMGYPGAEIARFLGVTTSAVVRAAKTEELEEVQKYL